MSATTVHVELNTREVERAFARLRDRMPQAIARAINRSIASAKTVMVRQVSQDMGLKAGDVRERIGVRKAHCPYGRTDQMVAQLTASDERLPLADFSAKGPEPSRGRGAGVTAKLRGGAKRYPQAFLTTMRSGHRGVFQRGATLAGRAATIGTVRVPDWPTVHSYHAHLREDAVARFKSVTGSRAGDRRSKGSWSVNLPIYELHGPSIVRVFEKHVSVGVARAKEQLAKNLQSEMRFALRQRA
jgi:hypothetical protein